MEDGQAPTAAWCQEVTQHGLSTKASVLGVKVGSVSILKHYLVLLFMCAQCVWGGFMCHCTCVEVQRIAFGVGSLLSPLCGFFMQVTKCAGHTALLAELSHQPSISMSADVETKPVRFMCLQNQRTTKKKLGTPLLPRKKIHGSSMGSPQTGLNQLHQQNQGTFTRGEVVLEIPVIHFLIR